MVPNSKNKCCFSHIFSSLFLHNLFVTFIFLNLFLAIFLILLLQCLHHPLFFSKWMYSTKTKKGTFVNAFHHHTEFLFVLSFFFFVVIKQWNSFFCHLICSRWNAQKVEYSSRLKFTEKLWMNKNIFQLFFVCRFWCGWEIICSNIGEMASGAEAILQERNSILCTRRTLLREVGWRTCQETQPWISTF